MVVMVQQTGHFTIVTALVQNKWEWSCDHSGRRQLPLNEITTVAAISLHVTCHLHVTMRSCDMHVTSHLHATTRSCDMHVTSHLHATTRSCDMHVTSHLHATMRSCDMHVTSHLYATTRSCDIHVISHLHASMRVILARRAIFASSFNTFWQSFCGVGGWRSEVATCSTVPP